MPVDRIKNSLLQGLKPRLLVCQCRNYGDSIIGLSLIEALGRTYPGLEIDVLTRPEFVGIHANNPCVKRIHTADFPIGTLKKFTLKSAMRLLWVLGGLVMRRYTCALNIFGDVRENLFCILASPLGSVSVLWPEGHPVRNQIRLPGWLAVNTIAIAPQTLNIYNVVNEMACALGTQFPVQSRLHTIQGNILMVKPGARKIGMHVSAGQESRRWPLINWVKLAERLVDGNEEVVIFCSPTEIIEIKQAFKNIESIYFKIIAGSLDTFFENLTECKLLICHDSFAVHAAYALGVPRIMLNGSNMYQVWAPPETIVLEAGSNLPCYPCFNKPTCLTSGAPFRCIRDITVESVYDTLSK